MKDKIQISSLGPDHEQIYRGENRYQSTLFPESVDDYVEEDSVVRVIDVFIDRLDVSRSGFKTEAAETGRPGYHPHTMLKIYVYGDLNRVHSSRRLDREARRNVELMWLSARLAPDFKTIADFGKDNGEAIRLVCREFVMLCRKLNMIGDTLAIDGSKFKAVNNRDITAYVPLSVTSNNKARGHSNRAEFHYIEKDGEYMCPAGERLIYRFTSAWRRFPGDLTYILLHIYPIWVMRHMHRPVNILYKSNSMV